MGSLFLVSEDTQQHIDYTKLQIGRVNTAIMEKLSFLLLSMAVLWIALTLATPSAAEQVGETDLIMGIKTLNRGLRSADAKKKGDIKKKNKRRRNKKGKAGKRRKNKKKNKGNKPGRRAKTKKPGNKRNKKTKKTTKEQGASKKK